MIDLLYKNSKHKNNILLITISESRYEYRYNNKIIDYFGIDSRKKI